MLSRGRYHAAMHHRVATLERRMPPNRRAAWRSFLTAYFAASEYDGHRAAIIDALTSDLPHYSFTGADGTLYAVGWWDRNHAPAVKVIRRGSRAADVEDFPPPTVRTYEGIAGDI